MQRLSLIALSAVCLNLFISNWAQAQKKPSLKEASNSVLEVLFRKKRRNRSVEKIFSNTGDLKLSFDNLLEALVEHDKPRSVKGSFEDIFKQRQVVHGYEGELVLMMDRAIKFKESDFINQAVISQGLNSKRLPFRWLALLRLGKSDQIDEIPISKKKTAKRSELFFKGLLALKWNRVDPKVLDHLFKISVQYPELKKALPDYFKGKKGMQKGIEALKNPNSTSQESIEQFLAQFRDPESLEFLLEQLKLKSANEAVVEQRSSERRAAFRILQAMEDRDGAILKALIVELLRFGSAIDEDLKLEILLSLMQNHYEKAETHRAIAELAMKMNRAGLKRGDLLVGELYYTTRKACRYLFTVFFGPTGSKIVISKSQVNDWDKDWGEIINRIDKKEFKPPYGKEGFFTGKKEDADEGSFVQVSDDEPTYFGSEVAGHPVFVIDTSQSMVNKDANYAFTPKIVFHKDPKEESNSEKKRSKTVVKGSGGDEDLSFEIPLPNFAQNRLGRVQYELFRLILLLEPKKRFSVLSFSTKSIEVMPDTIMDAPFNKNAYNESMRENFWKDHAPSLMGANRYKAMMAVMTMRGDGFTHTKEVLDKVWAKKKTRYQYLYILSDGTPFKKGFSKVVDKKQVIDEEKVEAYLQTILKAFKKQNVASSRRWKIIGIGFGGANKFFSKVTSKEYSPRGGDYIDVEEYDRQQREKEAQGGGG